MNEDVTILKRKGEETKEYKSEVELNDITLPVKQGEVIGELLIKDNSEIVKKIDLVSNNDMTKKSFINLYFKKSASNLTLFQPIKIKLGVSIFTDNSLKASKIILFSLPSNSLSINAFI